MNIQIFLKLLASLAVVTDNNVGPYAMALKQALEITLQGDPDASQQLSMLVAQPICNDWHTFNQVAGFTAQCLTQGKAENLPQAVANFTRIANESLSIA